jgi:hypothetical protein
MKCHNEIFAIAADCYLSPIRNRIPSEGLDDIKRGHLPPHVMALDAGKRIGGGRNVDPAVSYPQHLVTERD